VLWGIAFTSIYRRTNTRVAATRWIFSHVPPPAAFANEAWDDGLPMPDPAGDVTRYAGPSLALFDPDSPRKVEELVDALSKSDWVAVTSGRVYTNVTRVPDVFPMSIAYYRALFDGSLGFDLQGDFTSYPSLGPLRFSDDRSRSSSRSTTIRACCSSRRPSASRATRRGSCSSRRCPRRRRR
jgi:hypothetical protein